ncbi:MAG TPA: helix-turn-helix transcriptional regulator [Polyangiaceae bacterium]|nr:helix-turn-helix transcriptional regulator [Polyangiaceae bacterium]
MTKRARYTFDALLEELGDLEEVSQRSLKKGISEAARARMTERRITKQKLSQRMNTSRAQVDRILDPDDTSITLATLVKLALALELEAVIMLRRKEEATDRALQCTTGISPDGTKAAMARVVELFPDCRLEAGPPVYDHAESTTVAFTGEVNAA